MTTIAMHFPSGRNSRGVRRLFLDLVNGLREALEMRDHYEELAHKSDAELAALNMKRRDLPRIAQTTR